MTGAPGKLYCFNYGALRLGCLTVAAILQGCGGSSGVDAFSPSVDPPDNRGPRIASVPSAAEFTWDAAGDELFFTQFPERVRGVSTSTEALRDVYSVPGGITPRVGVLRRASSADLLYFVTPSAQMPSAQIVQRIDPKAVDPQPEQLFTQQSPGNALAVSSDGRFLAVPEALHDLVQGTTKVLSRGLPLSFSADAGSLLYHAETGAPNQPITQRLAVFSTADGSALDLDIPGWPDRAVRDGYSPHGGHVVHYWSGNDVQVVLADTVTRGGAILWKLSLFDSRTSVEREVATIPFWFLRLEGAISPSGDRLAVWGRRPNALFATDLHVVTVASGAVTIAATVNYRPPNAASVGSMAFSPDGRKLAYAIEGVLTDIHLLTF